MTLFLTSRRLLGFFMLHCALTSAQLAGQSQSVAPVDLKAKVELTRNGRRLKDSSQLAVWLTPLGATPAATIAPQQPSQIPQLVQKDKSFHPSLLVIPAGGQVEFPNRDPFFHNVFSLFDGKRFDLGLYERGTTRFVQFEKPGISYIFCNIHAQMSAVIIALNTPYYAISTPRGDLAIAHVPPGHYRLHLFQPSVSPELLTAAERDITVTPSNTSLGTFVFSESNLQVAHKNKYGRDYDPSDPDQPAYARP